MINGLLLTRDKDNEEQLDDLWREKTPSFVARCKDGEEQALYKNTLHLGKNTATPFSDLREPAGISGFLAQQAAASHMKLIFPKHS